MKAYISHRILPNGNLLLTASNEARHDCSKRLQERGSDDVFYEIMAPFRDNGILFPIEPEWIGALTSSPIISDYESVDDDGVRSIGDIIWWFPNYQIIDPMTELAHKGRVEFIRADSE